MKRKINFVIFLLFGLMFINSGLNKFFNYMPEPAEGEYEQSDAMWAALLEVGWIFPLVAIIEILSGVLFIIPKYRALGALLLFPVMVGVQIMHFTVYQPLIPMGLVLLAIHLWAIYDNREKYLPLVK